MNEKMKSFKVQDAVKKAVDRPRGPKKPAEEPAPAVSAGFPRIEALVEQEAPDLGELADRQAQLEALAKASKSQKEKLSAQRAAKAYDRARALVDQLLATKAGMRTPP